MDLRVKAGAFDANLAADALVVTVFEGDGLTGVSATVNEALGGQLERLMTSGDFSGTLDESLTLYPGEGLGVRRVILVGVGPAAAFKADPLRRAAAVGAQRARKLKASEVVFIPEAHEAAELNLTQAAQVITEGVLLGLYRYHGQKSDEAPAADLTTLTLLGEAVAELEQGLKAGEAFALGTLFARDLKNLPPNICTPEYMAQRAVAMAGEVGLRVTVLEKHQMAALKMGALLAVAQGSDATPRFIVLEHRPDEADKLDTLVLVGKGVTFDTGGYSLKSRDGMIGMKGDMGGGAAVLGAMRIVAALDMPLHVVGLVPASDNMISEKAYRPQEVITASNGKTIEIISTDAEGRLLLADALVYAQRYNPAAVVNIATLTGSIVGALGHAAAGLFGNDDHVREALLSAAASSDELLWHMPIYPEYAQALESDTADFKNSAGKGGGGAGVAASFLSNFVAFPWAHVDMAGMMSAQDQNGVPYIPGKGSTGYGARLLAEFVRQWSS